MMLIIIEVDILLLIKINKEKCTKIVTLYATQVKFKVSI